jgi:hypothetical protein
MVVDRPAENAEAYFVRGVLRQHKAAATAKLWSDPQRAIADIAQLVEQVIRNDQVVGSNPTIGLSANSKTVPYRCP